MSAHTPEPWRVDGYVVYALELDRLGRERNRFTAAVYTSLRGSAPFSEAAANAARIVACVNACAGLPDPAAELARLREVEREQAARIAEVEALLLKVLNALLPLAEDTHYGHPFVSNPHDYHPDDECCSKKEIAAHRAACDAYDRGEEWTRPASTAPIPPGEGLPEGADTGMVALDADGRSLGGTAHVYPWGIGTSVNRDDALCALIEEIHAALATEPTP